MAAEEEQDKKPDIPTKSSMEILSELFSTFQAKPPIIIKKEKTEKTEDSSKKHKKKKKHKHKDKKLDKKQKKKDKKRKRSRSDSSSDSSSSEGSEEKVDLAQILIKNEKENAEKKIKSVKKEKDSKQEEIPKKDVKVEVKVKDEVHKTEETGKKNKIVIKDLKLSKVFEAEAKKIYEKHADQEEGEASDSDSQSKHKCKKKHKSHSKKRSRSKSRERHHSDKKVKTEETKSKTSDSKYREKSKDRDKSRNHNRDHSRERNRDHSRDDRSRDDFYGRRKERSRERDSRRDKYSSTRESTRDHRSRDQHRDRDRDRDEYNHELEDYRRNRNKLNKDDDFYKSKDKGSSQRDEKWFMRDRYRGYDDRDKYDRDSSSKIDKKKLLEIARKNAITMMKSGSLPAALTLGPQAQEKVIAAIKSGGKTIEELTDFCKTLSKKEELGELSSLSEKEDSDSDTDKPFHHPFQIKDRPTSITMNIKNSVPLPIKSTVERTSELRIQFPVSSGQQHRKGEHWRPVSPPADKKADEQPAPAPVPAPAAAVPLAIEPAPVPELKVVTVPAPANAPPGPQVFPTPINEPSVDIGSIVSQRLTAMRRLQENPNDVQALGQMYKSNKEMQSWASSKQQLGQFTGSTGAQIMSQAELSSGYQAWAKKDQLQTAAPVSGGMGMHLLQKMGWKPGEGLGKEKTGQLEPLLLEVKLDKRGLVADEEQQGRGGKGKRQKGVAPTQKTLQGKHPVSLLGEYASKRKLGAPQYIMEFECGPDHKKNFLFKVVLNGLEYKPNVASNNKKEAKAVAATVCLQQIGLFPS